MAPDAHLESLIRRYPELAPCTKSIAAVHALMCTCYSGGNKVMICGNGGSAADGDHMAGELLKGFLRRRPVPEETIRRIDDAAGADAGRIARKLQLGLPTISLNSHPALQSAFSNDVESTLVYAQLVLALGVERDLVMGISTSGNSENVVAAVRVARGLGMTTVCLTGESGGRLAGFCDACIRVPAEDTPHVQELHLPVYHTLCAMVESSFF
ncbi:MAG: D-sedoheptulose-7-phosphate isomerase [Spirochaetota bacterium]